MQRDLYPLLAEEVGFRHLAIGEHLLLVLVVDVRVEIAGTLLGAFECGDTDAFVDGRVAFGSDRLFEVDEGGGHLAPVAELEGSFAEAASGDDGYGVGGAAVDLDDGDEAFAVGGAGLGDAEEFAAEDGHAHAEDLTGAEVAVGDLCLAEQLVKGVHRLMIDGLAVRVCGCGIVEEPWPRAMGNREVVVGIVWRHFALGFSALLPLINPLGSALVFLGLVGIQPPAVYKSLARQIAINMILFLAVIELIGSYLLSFFGISLPIVQLAGGVVVAAIGWGVLNQSDNDSSSKSADAQAMSTKSFASSTFYPLMFPITAGPGCLVVMLTLSAHTMEGSSLTDTVLARVGLMIAVLLLSALVYVCYGYAPQIARKISPSTVHGILRVIAFILLCIGVQIAWNGLEALLVPLLKSGRG